MKFSHLASALLASSMLFTAVNANAADPITVSGTAAFTTDYMFRGVSQTSSTAATQVGMTFAHESGAYFSAWGSSVVGAVSAGGLELDTLLGYSGKTGEVAYDVGVMRYNYPANNVPYAYNELYGSVSTMGAKLGLNFSSDYYNKSDKFMYLYASYGTEIAGIGLSGSVGMNKFDSTAMMTQALALGGTNTDDSYIDYKLAASKALAGITFEGAYIGSNIGDDECGTLCEGRFVLTMTKGF
jgi:uncharacterized protein (TIGR02001 family)